MAFASRRLFATKSAKSSSEAFLAKTMPYGSFKVPPPLYTPSGTYGRQQASAESVMPRWASALPHVHTITPGLLHPALKSSFKPTAREAKKQILGLVLPQERMQPIGRTLGYLGRGVSSTALTRLTNSSLTLGRLSRLLSSRGKTAKAEAAVLRSVLQGQLNEALVPLREKHDAECARQGADFATWYTSRQQLTVIDQLERLLRLVAPYIEMKAFRKSGKMYTVPIPIGSESRRKSLLLKWLVEVIRARPEKKLQHRVVCELSDLRTFRSGLYKKIAEVYAAAYANRSYTHFRA